MDSGAARALKHKSIRGLSVPVWALLGSVMLHVLLLWPWGGHWRLPSWLGAKPPRLALRVLAPPAQPARLPLASAPSTTLAQALSPPTPPAKEAQVATPTPTPVPTPPEHPASAPSDDPDEGYLPSEYLSSPANPLAEIALQDIASPETSGRLQLVLWITKEGEVVKVDVEVTEAPGWFTDQVIERFQQARFEPGIKDGQPVASQMRIEVSF